VWYTQDTVAGPQLFSKATHQAAGCYALLLTHLSLALDGRELGAVQLVIGTKSGRSRLSALSVPQAARYNPAAGTTSTTVLWPLQQPPATSTEQPPARSTRHSTSLNGQLGTALHCTASLQPLELHCTEQPALPAAHHWEPGTRSN
jgi:hypothetical protein